MRIFAALALCGLFLLTGCSGPKEPEFQRLENVRLKTLPFKGELQFTADAIMHNPNPIGVEITTLDLDVEMEHSHVADISQDVSAKMPPNGDFALPLEFYVPIKEVFKDWKGLLGGTLSNQTVDVHVDGHCKVSVASATVKVPIKFSEHVVLLK